MTTLRDEEAARAWAKTISGPPMRPDTIASLAAFRAEARREALEYARLHAKGRNEKARIEKALRALAQEDSDAR